MSAQYGHGQKTGSERLDARDFGISRSRVGLLNVRFDGGPSYPEMVESLKEMVDRHGSLVKRGDRISGAEWLRRIDQSNVRITERQRQAIQTLMQSN